MRETGLMERKRNFKTEADLLIVLLMYLSNDTSPAVTATQATVAGIATCTDVSLLKKIKLSADFFQLLNSKLLKVRGIKYSPLQPFNDYNVYAIDASTICEPGSTETDWRLLYSLELATLKCQQFIVTKQDAGESFLNFEANKNGLFLWNRAYGR